jgi:nucleoside-diphosphate-sugar epimerase
MIAITGANGYLGGLLCGSLAARGLAVRRLVRRPDASRGDAFFSLDAPVANAALDGVEILVHAAHDFRPAREPELRRVNLDGTRRLLDAAHGAGVRRVLFISSMSSYAGTRSAYGRLKWALEQDVLARGGASIRPGLVFGRERGGLFASLDRVVRRLPLVPDFGPSARLYVVHAGDLMRILGALLAPDDAPARGVVPAAYPTPFTMRQVLESIAEEAGVHPRFVRASPVLALAGMRTLEGAGLHLPFRSDSLIGMLHANPAPDLVPEVLGVRLRPLDAHTLRESR